MQSLDSILAEIRSEVCDTVLKWTLVIGIAAVVLSLTRILEFGFLPVMGLHLGLVGLLIVIYAARKRVPYRVRAGAIVGVMFAVAAAGHLSFGTPMRIEFFIAASIMATVFFGEKVGILTVAVCIAVLAAIYAGFEFQVLPPPIPMPPLSLTNWIANGASMLVAALAPLLAVNRFRRYLLLERERVIAASRTKSDFLATMSHELRTPMTAILGMTDLLLAGELPKPEKDKVFRIGKAGRLLLDILNDILDFSKIESDKVVIRPAPFRPREVVDEICALFGPSAAQRGVGLKVAYDATLPDEVVADAGRIRQVVLNLVGNAVKFTERGCIDVRVSLDTRDGAAPFLRIEVEDTGIGISPEQQAQLFRPFVQIDQGGSRRYGGTGLGLSISRRLVELMGGSIRFQSAAGQGSTFTVLVPVENRDAAGEISSAEAPAPALPARRLDLLVAEDNESIAFLMRSMLEKWGHRVDVVGDGRAALAAAMAKRYDAILMDMQMPHMDGATAARELRKRGGEGALVPIIAVTADLIGESTNAYLKAGANALVAKPVNWNELSAALSRLCAVPHTPDGAADPGDPPPPALVVLDEATLSDLREAVGEVSFAALLRSFSDSLSQTKAVMLDAISSGDAALAKRAAHSLKGLCAQFGAHRLAHLAGMLDAAPARGQALRARLTEAFSELGAALSARLG